jgi:hypothetical protein
MWPDELEYGTLAGKKSQAELVRTSEMIRAQIEMMKWKEEIERKNTYTPPLSFEQKIDRMLMLLEKYGPKLEVLADVMGAMHLDEKDDS